MQEQSSTVPSALVQLRKNVTIKTAEDPNNHLSEEQKVEYLYYTVARAAWDQWALKQCYEPSTPQIIQQPYTSFNSP